ncbi:MAG TPA: diacylglycerol kinase [Thiothrix sp.]|nr:diacylglycerol kinase [Thiothrix sp.]
MANNENKGIQRLLNASRYSWQGIKAAYKHEEAFRQEVWLFIVAVPLALWLGETAIEKSLMIVSVLLVMIVEILNSAIEAVVDRFGGEIHELSGRAKDMGSAAVTLSLLNAVIIWLFIVFL